MKPSKPQMEYVERVGRWWEIVGSRSAGRILGWLMICDPPHRSSAELAEELQLSSGSVSTQTSVLDGLGFLERITFPGDRASYYQLKPNPWSDLMSTELIRLKEMRRIALDAADVLPSERPDRVSDLERVAGFFVAEWPNLMDRLSEHLAKEKA